MQRLLTIPFSFLSRPPPFSHPHPKKKKKERNVLFHFSSVTRFTPVPRSKSQYFFEGGEKSDDIPKGRIFARRELLSTRYYASRRYNPLEAYAGQACPRPSFARSFTVVHVFMHFHPTTASWLDSTHVHTYTHTYAWSCTKRHCEADDLHVLLLDDASWKMAERGAEAEPGIQELLLN